MIGSCNLKQRSFGQFAVGLPSVLVMPLPSMGGVNHCHLHCRLAKFRDLMRRVKYGAVIGHKMRFFVCAQYELSGYGFFFSQSQRRI